LGTRDELEQIW